MYYIPVKLLDTRCMPFRAHETDAGADLVSTDTVTVYPGAAMPTKVNTGVSVAIPKGYVGLIYSRSSQGKQSIRLANCVGVIDSDYRGELSVLIKNDGNTPYLIEAYRTKIAQLVITPIILANFEVSDNNDWANTTRGINGFGSTGN